MPGKRDSTNLPQDSKAEPVEFLSKLVDLTDGFCQTHLNEEYAALCRKMVAELAAIHPSPLLRGKIETWACGIVRTVGWVNFLDDSSQSPHLKLPRIDEAFGVAESTGQGKSRTIRKMLGIHHFDHRWTLPSLMDSAPMIWLLLDSRGFMIDIREQALELQREAWRRGLIPYVPADRAAAELRARIEASPARRLFQFKVSLRGSQPLVWRRIQVLDDALDRFHEHLQMAMGWTNSHLHEFTIGEKFYGDPELLGDEFERFTGVDSTKTLLSDVLPEGSAPFSFEYCYDFGDGWVHDVLFEGNPEPQPGVVYPQCVDGERACPPEDVGGVDGYAEYLQAIADPNHEKHEDLLAWRGSHRPDAFKPGLATHHMQEGMPEWRKMTEDAG